MRTSELGLRVTELGPRCWEFDLVVAGTSTSSPLGLRPRRCCCLRSDEDELGGSGVTCCAPRESEPTLTKGKRHLGTYRPGNSAGGKAV
jgi:hypothetical protein